jgi:hypothetical protein
MAVRTRVASDGNGPIVGGVGELRPGRPGGQARQGDPDHAQILDSYQFHNFKNQSAPEGCHLGETTSQKLPATSGVTWPVQDGPDWGWENIHCLLGGCGELTACSEFLIRLIILL